MFHVLIVITYLGGASWGPVVSQQEYASAASCEAARQHVLDTIAEMNKKNLIPSRSFRDIVKADCIKK